MRWHRDWFLLTCLGTYIMGNKTTMWPERTHKIRRTPLSLKRVLHPVLSHSSLCLLFCCFCLTPCHSRSVHISIHFLSHLAFRRSLLYPLTGHAGGTAVSQWPSTANRYEIDGHFRFRKIISASKSAARNASN